MTRIDAHVHLWDLAVRPQPWTAPFPALHRSFELAELAQVLAAHEVDAAIVVQAGDSFDETADLLALAATGAVLAGVVGWVDLTGDVPDQVAALRAGPGGSRLVAVRHQLQVEPDAGWFGRPDVRRGLAALAGLGLAYDVVVSASQLALVVETVAAVPETRFVLDHAGKPSIVAGDLARWRADLASLAALPNVAVKLSGLVTEADWERWTVADLRPVVEHVLACFGPERVMLGSDWPVCLLAADYSRVQASIEPAVSLLTPSEQEQVRGGTAARWYGVGG